MVSTSTLALFYLYVRLLRFIRVLRVPHPVFRGPRPVSLVTVVHRHRPPLSATHDTMHTTRYFATLVFVCRLYRVRIVVCAATGMAVNVVIDPQRCQKMNPHLTAIYIESVPAVTAHR